LICITAPTNFFFTDSFATATDASAVRYLIEDRPVTNDARLSVMSEVATNGTSATIRSAPEPPKEAVKLKFNLGIDTQYRLYCPDEFKIHEYQSPSLTDASRMGSTSTLSSASSEFSTAHNLPQHPPTSQASNMQLAHPPYTSSFTTSNALHTSTYPTDYLSPPPSMRRQSEPTLPSSNSQTSLPLNSRPLSLRINTQLQSLQCVRTRDLASGTLSNSTGLLTPSSTISPLRNLSPAAHFQPLPPAPQESFTPVELEHPRPKRIVKLDSPPSSPVDDFSAMKDNELTLTSQTRPSPGRSNLRDSSPHSQAHSKNRFHPYPYSLSHPHSSSQQHHSLIPSASTSYSKQAQSPQSSHPYPQQNNSNALLVYPSMPGINPYPQSHSSEEMHQAALAAIVQRMERRRSYPPSASASYSSSGGYAYPQTDKTNEPRETSGTERRRQIETQQYSPPPLQPDPVTTATHQFVNMTNYSFSAHTHSIHAKSAPSSSSTSSAVPTAHMNGQSRLPIPVAVPMPVPVPIPMPVQMHMQMQAHPKPQQQSHSQLGTRPVEMQMQIHKGSGASDSGTGVHFMMQGVVNPQGGVYYTTSFPLSSAMMASGHALTGLTSSKMRSQSITRTPPLPAIAKQTRFHVGSVYSQIAPSSSFPALVPKPNSPPNAVVSSILAASLDL
jgi:hypothetical protein